MVRTLLGGQDPCVEYKARAILLDEPETTARIVAGGTYADWGPIGKRCANPLVTIDALWALTRAGPAVE